MGSLAAFQLHGQLLECLDPGRKVAPPHFRFAVGNHNFRTPSPTGSWRGAVRGDPNSPNWLRVSMVFLLACLVSCACMRLLVRHHAELRTATFGIVYLVSGLVGSWLTLRAWRRYRSTQCVFALVLFSGLGGSGLYMA